MGRKTSIISRTEQREKMFVYNTAPQTHPQVYCILQNTFKTLPTHVWSTNSVSPAVPYPVCCYSKTSKNKRYQRQDTWCAALPHPPNPQLTSLWLYYGFQKQAQSKTIRQFVYSTSPPTQPIVITSYNQSVAILRLPK